MIYFIQMGADGPVKIGHSTAPARRLSSLQTGCPVQLRLLSVTDGDEAAERATHERFAGLRIRGEWFSPGDDLLGYAMSFAVLTPAEIEAMEAGEAAISDYEDPGPAEYEERDEVVALSDWGDCPYCDNGWLEYGEGQDGGEPCQACQGSGQVYLPEML